MKFKFSFLFFFIFPTVLPFPSKNNFNHRAENLFQNKLVEIRLTGIRSTVHSEDCKIMDGTIKINLVDDSCKDVLFETVSGTETFAGNKDNNELNDQWDEKTVAKIVRKNLDKSPKNYNHSVVFSVPENLIKSESFCLGLSYSIQGCHTHQKNVFGAKIGERFCSVYYSSIYEENNRECTKIGNYSREFSLIEGDILSEGPIQIRYRIQNLENYSHEMYFYFEMKILD